MNRWLETDTQKTARSIINALNESAAGMVKKEINKDKPEEAPKNKKVALEKRITKAAIKGKKPESKNAKMPKKIAKKVVKEELEPETKKSIEDQIADLQDYLDNTPEVSDEERAEIQAEIDDLISQLGEKEVDNKIMNESAPGTDAYDKLVQGDDVYFRNEEGIALLGHYADNYPEPEEYDEGFKPEYGGTEEGLQKAKEAAANRDVWEFMEVFEDTLQPMNEIYAYVYGQDDLMEMLKTLRQVNVVKKLEENQIEDARKDSIEKGLLSEAVFEIDYAPDGEDLSTENAVIDSVNKWLDPISDAVEVTVVELNGPSGWPVVRLSGNKEEIADFLYSNYNSGEDSLEDIIKSHLVNEAEEIDTEFKVGDVVKVPYKYGSYTPGEFTEAPIIDISEGRYVTVEIPSKLEVTMDQLKKWNTLGECDESLKEAYSDKLGGDPADFVSDVEAIKAKLSEIDTSGFGSHLAVQMVEDWIETCDYQIEKGKRLASGNEFYTEADDRDKSEENLKTVRDTISDVDFSVNSGRVDGDIPEFEAKYNIKITNITEPGAHHNAVYSIEGKEEDVQRFKDDILVEADDRTYKDRDEAEYYRNKELYANSNLARHREAMEKAKAACEAKGIKLDESIIDDLKIKHHAKKAAKIAVNGMNKDPKATQEKHHKEFKKAQDAVDKAREKEYAKADKLRDKAKKLNNKADKAVTKGMSKGAIMTNAYDKEFNKSEEAKPIAEAEDNYLSRIRKEEPLDLVAYEPEITSIDEVKDKYVKIRGDFHKVIDVKPEGDKFVISFAAGTGTAIGGEFEPATLDEIKRLQLYTENK